MMEHVIVFVQTNCVIYRRFGLYEVLAINGEVSSEVRPEVWIVGELRNNVLQEKLFRISIRKVCY
jgi:hypothetical protein